MTLLPPEFKFSQHSLSDFAECPRRFYFKYSAKQAWPLLETGPGAMDPLTYQAYLRRGTVLHRWIERHWLGIEDGLHPARTSVDDSFSIHAAPLWSNEDDPELTLWWQRFMNSDFSDIPALCLPELELVAPLGDALLYARFDLLAVHLLSQEEIGEAEATAQAGRGIIIDWKTLRGEDPPSIAFFRNRLQTRIYLYVLATAGAPFNQGQLLAPEQCSMRYWLANFPERPWVTITYSQEEYAADHVRLHGLIEDATRRSSEAEFEKTSDERHCTYCNYRTLCQRRGADGAAHPNEETSLIDLETIPTLDY